MSDTPRTDAFEALLDRPINWWDFARELERENAALREQLKLAKVENNHNWQFQSIHEETLKENAALRAALDQQASYQRELRTDRDRLDWLLSKDGGWWAYWQLDYGPWTADKDELIRRIDAARKEAQP